MSTANAVPLDITVTAGFARKDCASLGLRALLYCLLFSILFMPEFPRSTTPSFIYQKAASGFRVIDLVIFIVALIHVVFLACLRTRRIHFPRELAVPGIAFLACIVAAAIYGGTRGGNNFFFDWRGLALGIALYFVWSYWLQNDGDAAFAILCFAAYMIVRLCLLYLLSAAGSNETLLGTSIPIFDGPILSSIVFATLLGMSSLQHSIRLFSRIAWLALAVAGGLMVLLCLRRTYWAEIIIGALILLLLHQRHRARNIAVAGTVVCVVGVVLGPSFQSRVQSLDITRSDTQYSADNADHLNDLYDAWYQVQSSPVFGIGLGTSYETWHIRNWKSESVMVHNAPLHVWLKYGLAGLLCYLWFHIALLRWLYRQARVDASSQKPFITAACSYLCAQFIVTLGFSPWPYSELQLTLLMSFILATVVAMSAGQSSQNA